MRGRGPAAGLALLLAAAGGTACVAERPPERQLPTATPGSSAAGQTSRASGPPVRSSAPATTRPPSMEQPLPAYRALAADWRRARSRFFAEIGSGRPRSLPEQHALAATYLTGMRRFAAGMRARTWPAAARAAVAELLAANARQQGHLAAMTRAPGPSAFTERLAGYGVDAGRENRAVAAVERALGGG